MESHVATLAVPGKWTSGVHHGRAAPKGGGRRWREAVEVAATGWPLRLSDHLEQER